RLSVVVNRSRKRRTKTGEVCAAVYGVDVVSERIDLFVIAIVVLDGDLDRETLAFLLEVDWLVVERRLVLVQVFDELRDAAFVVELVRTLRLFPLVLNRNADAF